MGEYLDRETAVKAFNNFDAGRADNIPSTLLTPEEFAEYLYELPTVDAVVVTRCKDCKHSTLPSELTQRYGKPFDFEKTLVHELLHLKFSFWCQNEDDVGDRAMHQIIDDIARALTEKRKCEENGNK